MNIIDYIKHITFEPSYYQRNFDNDVTETPISPNWMDQAKRAGLIALPFISLYSPAGKVISVSMGTVRVVTNITEVVKAAKEKNALACAYHLQNTAVAIVAVAATIFAFQIGQLISTSHDIVMSLAKAIMLLQKKEYELAMQELMQAAGSMLYLAIMLSGSLEVTLASILLQAAISLVQARQEFKEGRWPEFIAKISMGFVRFYQAKSCIDQIQQRNSLLALEKYVKLMQQMKKAREVGHLIESPLQDANNAAQPGETQTHLYKEGGAKDVSHLTKSPLNSGKEEVVLVDADGNEFNFGAYVHGYGQGTVKGMNLQFRTTEINGKNMKEIDFKVNHVFRDRLEGLINELKGFSQAELKSVLELTNSHAKGIKIETVPFKLSSESKFTIGNAYKIHFAGLGTVLVGASESVVTTYDRVRVLVDENKSLYDLHEMLSFLDLDDAFRVSSKDDIERLKIGQLFRMFCPKEATLFEKTEAFFATPVDKLKDTIVKHVPSMQAVFDKYLAGMKPVENLPGQVHYAVPEIAKEAYDLGARSLVTTITSHGETAYNRLASILKMGLLSSEMRYRNGMQISGLSSTTDLHTGGGDSVFMQLLTESNFKSGMGLNNLYWGDIRIYISLNTLNTETNQQLYDSFGTKQGDAFLNRPNVFKFIGEENKYFHHGHELMAEDGVMPSLFEFISVPTQQVKNELLDYLRGCDLVQKTGKMETILGIPVNDFIQVGTTLNNKMLKLLEV